MQTTVPSRAFLHSLAQFVIIIFSELENFAFSWEKVKRKREEGEKERNKNKRGNREKKGKKKRREGKEKKGEEKEKEKGKKRGKKRTGERKWKGRE